MERVCDTYRDKSNQPASAKSEAMEPEIICADDPAPWPRYKPGMYDLRCTGYEFVRVRMYGNSWKLRLHFRFMDMEHTGRVCKFFHMGNESKPKAGRKSEYFRAWILANGGRLPRKGAALSPRKFTGHVFKCVIQDVRRTLDPGVNHGEEGIYSTVAKIVELCA
jgi:hypothetical protein